MSLIHPFANCLIITLFESFADIKHPLFLANHISRAPVVLIADAVLYGIKLLHSSATEEFLSESGSHPLAGRATVVVRRADQLVLHTGIEKHQLVAVLLRIEREVFKFHRTAVKPHKIALLAEAGSELVHDSALHADIVVLGCLTYAGKLEPVGIEAEKIAERIGKSALERCRR